MHEMKDSEFNKFLTLKAFGNIRFAMEVQEDSCTIHI